MEAGTTTDFDSTRFDVAVAWGAVDDALASELRRVVWPSGTVGAWSEANAEDAFKRAGLRAVQSRQLAGGFATRGAR